MQKRRSISLPIADVKKHSKALAKHSKTSLLLVSIKQTAFVQINYQINQIIYVNIFFDRNGKLKYWLTIIQL